MRIDSVVSKLLTKGTTRELLAALRLNHGHGCGPSYFDLAGQTNSERIKMLTTQLNDFALGGRMKALASDAVISLTPRDEWIVKTLSIEVPLLTLNQIARTSWRGSKAGLECARRRLGQLIRAGLVESFEVRAHPELDLQKPLWIWRPGEPPPPFGVVSYQARIRWNQPLRTTTIFRASKRLARQFAGSGGRLSRPLQVTHDIHVAALYLKLVRHRPEEAAGWVSDAVLAPLRRGQKLPDAEIHDERGRTVKVIEFGGGYPPERMQKVHADSERRQVPYELW